jgi:putative aldouronate transport system substrate-binding protein
MKRICSVITVFLLVMLASCGNSANQSGGSSAGGQLGGSGTVLANATWDSPELSWRQDTSPITYSLFLDIAWAPMDVWGNDHVSQKVTELTGVRFDVTKRQDANHLNTIIASGEYPDAIFVFTNKYKYEDPSISQPWNKLVEQYAPEFNQLIDPSAIAGAVKEDGNFYTLYTHFRNAAYWADPTQPVSYGEADLMFRDDIMAALGSPKLENLDDFYNLLKLCKERFPDYTPYLEPNINSEALMSWMGVDFRFSDFKVGSDGKLSLIIRDKEKMREYFAFKNKLVQEGLMSVEGLTYNFEQQKQAILAGRIFATAAQIYDVDLFNSELAAADSKNYYTALNKPLSYKGAIQYAPVDANPGFAGLYITTACKNPGRLIRLMEFMFSPDGDRLTQWGVEGLDYTLNADGLPIINNDIEWKTRGDNVWYFGATFMTEVQKALVPANPAFSQVTRLMFDFKKYWTGDALLGKTVPLPETQENETKTSLATFYNNNRNIIISARNNVQFESAFNSFYTELESLDLDSYIAYAQSKYDIAKAGAR